MQTFSLRASSLARMLPAARMCILARLVSLAQIGELARWLADILRVHHAFLAPERWEDCVTNQKNLCVGGHSSIKAQILGNFMASNCVEEGKEYLTKGKHGHLPY